MNKLAIIFIFSCIHLVCVAQNELNEIDRVSDSLTMISRHKADIVLSLFDTISTPKLLYSIDDRRYYVIVKDAIKHKEYFITLDDLGNLKGISQVKRGKSRNKKQKKQEEQYQKILLRTDPFDFNQYHIGYITKAPKAKYIEGKPTYFVVKDVKGNRHGEYRLPGLTLPSIIDENLYVYLFKRITDESRVSCPLSVGNK